MMLSKKKVRIAGLRPQPANESTEVVEN